ncbi:MAG: cytochrome c3 family protein [Betaproteobacteria bacterium]|nr:cytochrome c3 family protein [Betaproteobacteria bacterium]
MIRYFLAAVSATFLLVVSLPARSDNPPMPSQINFPSSVGEVLFRHEAHVKDRGMKCADCHHQINAKKLNTPHPSYLQSSWINCKLCHDESGKVTGPVYACSACHRTDTRSIADETLSAKVVIHQQCWRCHEVGTAAKASKGCELCHSGKKAL